MATDYWGSTGTTATIDNSDAWQAWSVTSSTTITATTWMQWADSGTATATLSTVWHYWTGGNAELVGIRELTEEEQRELTERAERQRIEMEEAARRARELLESHLDDAQKKDLAEKGEFEVESQSGKKYAIKQGRAGNVFSLDERRRKTAKYCIHPEIDCPDEDTMLSQLLWLKWCEEAFLKIANRTQLAA